MLKNVARKKLKNQKGSTMAKVTICHATSSKTNPYNTIVVDSHATAGHFDNNGTPKSGHEDDILLAGVQTCPTVAASPSPSPRVSASPTPGVSPTPSATPGVTSSTLQSVGSPSPTASVSVSPSPGQEITTLVAAGSDGLGLSFIITAGIVAAWFLGRFVTKGAL